MSQKGGYPTSIANFDKRGTWTRYYNNGKVREICRFDGGKNSMGKRANCSRLDVVWSSAITKSGLLEGEYKEWYKRTVTKRAEILQGRQKAWRVQILGLVGRLREQSFYKAGKRDGGYKKFYRQTNILRVESTYKDGKEHGERRAYDRETNLQSIHHYEQGLRQGGMQKVARQRQFKGAMRVRLEQVGRRVHDLVRKWQVKRARVLQGRPKTRTSRRVGWSGKTVHCQISWWCTDRYRNGRRQRLCFSNLKRKRNNNGVTRSQYTKIAWMRADFR